MLDFASACSMSTKMSVPALQIPYSISSFSIHDKHDVGIPSLLSSDDYHSIKDDILIAGQSQQTSAVIVADTTSEVQSMGSQSEENAPEARLLNEPYNPHQETYAATDLYYPPTGDESEGVVKEEAGYSFGWSAYVDDNGREYYYNEVKFLQAARLVTACQVQ